MKFRLSEADVEEEDVGDTAAGAGAGHDVTRKPHRSRFRAPSADSTTDSSDDDSSSSSASNGSAALEQLLRSGGWPSREGQSLFLALRFSDIG